jgi:hypothetical protein
MVQTTTANVALSMQMYAPTTSVVPEDFFGPRPCSGKTAFLLIAPSVPRKPFNREPIANFIQLFHGFNHAP